MKTLLTSTMVALGALCCFAIVASAEEPKAGRPSEKAAKPAVVAKPEKRASSAKTAAAATPKTKVVAAKAAASSRVAPIRRFGSVADTFSPVFVIDQDQIQRSGAGTTAELLRKGIPTPR